MSDLRAACGPLSFGNPFVLASAPPTASYELIRKAFSLGWGGAVTKTIKPDNLVVADVSPRFNAVGPRLGEVSGFENIELVSRRDLAYWVDSISKLKREFPEKPLIASIMGDTGRDSWAGLAAVLGGAGADALELNFSCPHGMPEKGVGAAIGQSAEISARITGWVRAATKLPVIVKLTPNVTDVRPIARAVAAAGADMIAAINTVESLTGVDLERLEPQPSVGGFSTYGGYSGRAVKPIGLRVVSQIAGCVELPIMGMGGISQWSDAAEYIALGSSVVQVCTEVMLKGFGIVGSFTSGLSDYLDRMGFLSLEELRGAALGKLRSHESLERDDRRLPSLPDAGACVRCGRCAVACADGGYGAISIAADGASFDYAKCDGCSLCSHVCPAGAIRMVAEAAARGRATAISVGAVS
jgi:dihydropyrimidine dehydrogenase (NAD+) subunit PreA